jgi:hypothetical protein
MVGSAQQKIKITFLLPNEGGFPWRAHGHRLHGESKRHPFWMIDFVDLSGEAGGQLGVALGEQHPVQRGRVKVAAGHRRAARSARTEIRR